MMYRFVTAAIASMAACFVSAQVEVEDRRIPSGATPVPVAQPANNSAELFYQLQTLQQEILQLRGLVEQQAFEIKKLKQQRLDDYIDLDRRVSELSQGGVTKPTQSVAGQNNTVTSSTPRRSGSSADELKSYRAAMNLVLKQQKYDDAIVSLNKHLEDFPQGRYSANAQYWLGEIFLQKKDLEKAQSWFSRVISEFPSHSKATDAQYKLGTVYDLLGDKSTAKNLLEEVAKSNTNVARLARDYLEKNLSQ
ncbi:tol-pal system protein YbgF [Agarilytica rhodophyticola]|uniref:tol-pal system protein YbgF n=1 Tax=Agarilytica rhodophyticola TaxID=1737490 RepID=UPI001FEB05FA|nr:tol-pal system protein YbgF [Agarilytica rhodophyticola]